MIIIKIKMSLEHESEQFTVLLKIRIRAKEKNDLSFTELPEDILKDITSYLFDPYRDPW